MARGANKALLLNIFDKICILSLETLLTFDHHVLTPSISSLSGFCHNLRLQDDKANPWTEGKVKKSIVNCPGEQSRNYEQLI